MAGKPLESDQVVRRHAHVTGARSAWQPCRTWLAASATGVSLVMAVCVLAQAESVAGPPAPDVETLPAATAPETTGALPSGGTRPGATESGSEGLRGSLAPAPNGRQQAQPASDSGSSANQTGFAASAAPVVAAQSPTFRRIRSEVRASVRGNVAKQVIAPVAALPPRPVDPVQAPLRRSRIDEDPFAPTGISVGGLLLRPSIAQDMGYDSNPNRVPRPGNGSAVLRTEGEVKLQSDWSRHALTGGLRAGYNAFPQLSDANRPDAQGGLNLRLDVSRDTRIDLDSRLRVETERPGSVDQPLATANRPLNTQVGASAGATHAFGRVSAGLRGSVDQSDFEDVRLGDGTRVDQGDRNYTQYALRLRAGYEATPGVRPFIETEVDTRRYDRARDNGGIRRDSDGVAFRAGTTLELARTLTGEVAAGYQIREREDPSLTTLRGPILDASVIWAATPLTTLRVIAVSRIDESTAIGVDGVFVRRAGFEIEHAFRRYLTLTAATAFQRSDYRGIGVVDDVFTGAVRLDYKLSRSVVVRASFAHERLNSSVPGSDYTANIYLVGLRLQR